MTATPIGQPLASVLPCYLPECAAVLSVAAVPFLLAKGAMNLRDSIGADRLLPLRPGAQEGTLTRWLLIAQCTIAEAVGLPLTLADFGAPSDVGQATETQYFGPRPGEGYQPPPTPSLPPPTPPAP